MLTLKLNAMIAAGAAVALAAGGTALGAAISARPIDSAGVIHGCYTVSAHHGSHGVTLQNAGTTCPKGSIAISWNQRGRTGAQGRTGKRGPAGPGLVYTTASGVNGPAITTPGTYSFDLTVVPQNNSASSAAVSCGVEIPAEGVGGLVALFDTTYQMPAKSTSSFTLTGIGIVTGNVTPTVACDDLGTGQSVAIDKAQWWMAPVRTTG